MAGGANLSERYGDLTIVGQPFVLSGRRRVETLCICGTRSIKEVRAIRSGKTKSCGCLVGRKIGDARRRHSQSGQNRTSAYNIWTGMRARCRDLNRKYYGEKKIQVCERWNSFENFLEDMGPQPSPLHSIDRIECSGNYEPSNCRWATKLTQANNKTNNHLLTFEGLTLTLAEWSRKTGISKPTLSARVNRLGWEAKEALTIKPIKGANQYG